MRRIRNAHDQCLTSIAFLERDGEHCDCLVVTSSYDGVVRLWDIDTGKCIRTMAHDNVEPVGAIAFSPNGRYLVVSSLDSHIRIWDMSHTGINNYNDHNSKGSAVIVRALTGHTCTRYVCPFDFIKLSTKNISPEEEDKDAVVLVASGSENGQLLLWDTKYPQDPILREQCFSQDTVLIALSVSTASNNNNNENVSSAVIACAGIHADGQPGPIQVYNVVLNRT